MCSAVVDAAWPMALFCLGPQKACMTPGHDCGPCSRGPILQGSPSFSRPASFPETPRGVSSSQSGTEKSQSYRQPSGSFSVPGSSGGSFTWYKPSPDRYVGSPGPGSRPLGQPAFPSRGFSVSKVLPTGSRDAALVAEKQALGLGGLLHCVAVCIPLQFQLQGWGRGGLPSKKQPEAFATPTE